MSNVRILAMQKWQQLFFNNAHKYKPGTIKDLQMKRHLLVLVILFISSSVATYAQQRDTEQSSPYVTTVGAIDNSTPIVLYPNPAVSELNITFPAAASVKTIAIYNMIGKAMVVYKVTGTSANLDLESIPSGNYYARFINTEGAVIATRKFTRQ